MAQSENIREEAAEEFAPPPVIKGRHTFSSITQKISAPIFKPTPTGWFLGFGLSFALLMLFMFSIARLFSRGIGIWGVNQPVAWGLAITNFVWWIGIGHAGTLISAMLLLMNQKWRTSINRFAEAMTLFALACAGLYPILHLGRPEYFYWLLPYPNIEDVWPQFRSPLVWDVFAILIYGVVSLFFWYTGLLPDLATMRDRAKSRAAWAIYGMLALGWRNDARHWHRYERAYLMLAALATPLVVSVHSIVSYDFSVAILPGWHTTLSPPYFVAGAAFSGLAMVIIITIPLRAAFRLEDFITKRHFDNLAKIMLAMGLLVTYGYIIERFSAWYGGNLYEAYNASERARGVYALMFWTQIVSNAIAPQLLWFKRVRTNLPILFVLSLVICTGMWFERYVIVIESLHRDFLPSSWGVFSATLWDWATLVGSFGLFLSLLFLFVRFLPSVSMSEMRKLLQQSKVKEDEA
ncbi:MAG: hydrogenase [Acidobacteria bacterium 13_1_20CM_3_53_8]|nr:MAG: hydrogenase [Acidobacteria bacterium 13_1_20CM_3_53_8]